MPWYQYRCDTHGDIDLWRSMNECMAPAVCSVCDFLMARVFVMPNISADATPTRRPEAAEKNRMERELAADRDAYKRMRMQGLQPHNVKGSALIEKHAETKHEVEMGRLLPDKKLVKQGVDLASQMVGKDLEV